MILVKMQRRRTVFMTMSLFFLCVMLVLNMMANQLQSSNTLEQLDMGEVQEPEKEFRNYIAKGRRNPMAAIEKTLSDSDTGLGNLHVDHNSDITIKHNSLFDKLDNGKRKNRNRIIDLQGLNPVHVGLDDDKDEDDYYNDDNDDINNVVIEDSADEDEDDIDEDNENDSVKIMHQKLDKRHDSMFQSKHFNVNRSKLIFTKPQLQYKEVSNNGAPAMAIKNGQGSHKKRGVTQEGIYWSSMVEDLVPKGKAFSCLQHIVSHVLRNDLCQSFYKPQICHRHMIHVSSTE